MQWILLSLIDLKYTRDLDSVGYVNQVNLYI